MRLGIAHHLGWAIAVTATDTFEVVDRRRIELVEPGLPSAPIHHLGGPWEAHREGDPIDDKALIVLVAEVRASSRRAGKVALDKLVAELQEPITSMAIRNWPDDFPQDIAVLRCIPYESRADSVMYCQVLAELAHDRDWAISRYDAKSVETDARRLLGDRGDTVLNGPRARLGAPWTKDHRVALAATVVVSPSSA